jgi:hypothetical protein
MGRLMANLICVKLETCHANTDGTAWYAYFDDIPTQEEINICFDDPTKRDDEGLGLDSLDGPELVPNVLSKHFNIFRYYIGTAG